MRIFPKSPLTLHNSCSCCQSSPEGEKRGGRSSPKCVTSTHINSCLDEPCCDVDSVLIYIDKDIPLLRKKGFFHCVSLYPFRIESLPKVSALRVVSHVSFTSDLGVSPSIIVTEQSTDVITGIVLPLSTFRSSALRELEDLCPLLLSLLRFSASAPLVNY